MRPKTFTSVKRTSVMNPNGKLNTLSAVTLALTMTLQLSSLTAFADPGRPGPRPIPGTPGVITPPPGGVIVIRNGQIAPPPPAYPGVPDEFNIEGYEDLQ